MVDCCKYDSIKLIYLQHTKTLTTALRSGGVYEFYVNVTSVGYATTFNGDKLDITLFTKNGKTL